ncbi:MAG: hypothetical protein CL927_03020 [Deltaproteobacteria bacterium]|nr:hypothetical protein [Deltaproteobacteria bacterium]HCH66653.1 hypothetical protein [Deltaproteobacteria bacterium]
MVLAAQSVLSGVHTDTQALSLIKSSVSPMMVAEQVLGGPCHPLSSGTVRFHRSTVYRFPNTRRCCRGLCESAAS